jgi:uncharacterized membrane protein
MASLPQSDWIDRLGRVVTTWRRLFIGLGVAAVAGLLAAVAGLFPLTALLVGWDSGVAVYLVLIALLIRAADTAEIRRRAAQEDVGRMVILALTAVAALASLVAIYVEVNRVGEQAFALWRLALDVVTVGLSWFLVQVIFAIHYAHDYYGPGEAGGLAFPGGKRDPNYGDFLYFALVVGMTSQVSDVAVTGARMRRTVAAHGVIAFWFNVAVLALLINVAADAIRNG